MTFGDGGGITVCALWKPDCFMNPGTAQFCAHVSDLIDISEFILGNTAMQWEENETLLAN